MKQCPRCSNGRLFIEADSRRLNDYYAVCLQCGYDKLVVSQPARVRKRGRG